MELLIKNAYLIDPLQNIKGEIVDIPVKDGKIVEDVSSSAEVIDVGGRLVMPGGIDIHSHIAGPKVNVGRLIRPEDHYNSFMSRKPSRRSGSGKTTPTTYITGYRYARMGWTMVVEPATPPLKTRHTHEELDDVPIIDKACIPLVDSNWVLLHFLSRGDLDSAAIFVAWLLQATKGYGLKLVDPGVALKWIEGTGFGLGFDEQIPIFNITPREIVRGLGKVNEMLRLPHPIHVHCNRLGIPGNYETTVETIREAGRSIGRIHITHAQFNSYKGENWAELKPGSEEVAKAVMETKGATLDMGQLIFGTSTTMTADAPFEFALYHLTSIRKWAGGEVEAESASGVVPFKYKKKNLVNAVQWCIGLELALLVEDPWKVFLTTDHPNGGPFTRYPRIMLWLMRRKAREEILNKISRAARRRALLPSLEREYTLYEIAVMTRASPARILGLENVKGTLRPGADADISVYDVKPDMIDEIGDEEFVKTLRYAYLTVKSGRIVVKNGEVTETMYGSTYYVKHPKAEEFKTIEGEVKELFQKWYTVNFNQYTVHEREVRSLKPVEVM